MVVVNGNAMRAFATDFATAISGQFAISVIPTGMDENGIIFDGTNLPSQPVPLSPLIHLGYASPLAEEIPFLKEGTAPQLWQELQALNKIVQDTDRGLPIVSPIERGNEDKQNEKIRNLALFAANQANANEGKRKYNDAAIGFFQSAVLFVGMSRCAGHNRASAQMLRAGEIFLLLLQPASAAIVFELAEALAPRPEQTIPGAFHAEKSWLAYVSPNQLVEKASKCIGIYRGLQNSFRHRSWDCAARLFEILSQLDFDNNLISSSAENQIRMAWAMMQNSFLRPVELKNVIGAIDTAILLWNEDGAHGRRVKLVQEFLERAHAIAGP